MAQRYGVLNCFKAVALLYPMIYILTPYTALFPTQSSQQIAMFAVMFLKSWAVIFAFPCTTILLTNCASSLRVLATLNGVATSISAIGRGTGPFVGGWAFSFGVEKGFMIVPFWTLAVFAILGAIPVWVWIVEMPGFGNVGDELDDEGDGGEQQTPHQGAVTGSTSRVPIPNSLPEEFAVADSETSKFLPIASEQLSKTISNSESIKSARKSLSWRPIGPIGMGEQRRLSDGLGHSRSGYGAGGTSYH